MLMGTPDVNAAHARGLCDSLKSGVFVFLEQQTKGFKMAHGGKLWGKVRSERG
jgi:hypothetical protein